MQNEKVLKLWETTRVLREVYAELEENDGELTPEIEARLARAEPDRRRKASSIMWLITESQKLGDAFAQLAIEYQGKARVRRNLASNLTQYLLAEMRGLGETELHTDLGTVVRGKMPGVPLVQLLPGKLVARLGKQFRRLVPQEWVLDKKAVIDWLKKEDKIPEEPGRYQVGNFEVTVRERLRLK